ncbi:CPBP family intramembrane metalloprotease [Flammeovirga pectinis]|uniref:CPBP family intramembrane metalloprotease n=1 Tax=Flammeovirga pectinis TaxID=2494373 RepID=A0A3Q9FS25_9BACT|nr:CPBP family intramembrane glutamic endopeptidase [Flammeovirga pectinis]AZQ63431.1 CPBP family intramembrane metalloprotease [Flammeovirga pectinis]
MNQDPFNYFKKFLFLILFIIAFTFIGQAVVVAVLLPIFDFDVNSIFSSITAQDNRTIMLIVQGISALFTFILGPIAYGFWYDKALLNTLRSTLVADKRQWVIAIFVIVAFLPLGSALLVWNQHIDFPSSLATLEASFKAKEIQLAQLTVFLVDFQSTGEFLLGLIVIAVFAGIGEELVFRGFLQRYLEGIFKNVHVGIWLTAIIFSAIHMQFYGFFVRMFLGVLLGYLFLWSGRSLYPSIIAHITNNALTVIGVYFNKEELLEEMANPFDAEAPEWYIVVISGIFAVALLMYYRKLYLDKRDNSLN